MRIFLIFQNSHLLSRKRRYQIKDKKKNGSNSGDWVGVGAGLGAAIFALTGEPVWIAVGVALGAAISWTYRK